MKVSICLITYNHERFLAQSLDSILAQEHDFAIEILIGEDGSTDGTAQIVSAYARRHPDIIKPEFHPDTDKIIINGRITGRRNFIATLMRASGDYVIIVDGDDYWIGSRKLADQVEFLDTHPEFSACFHNAICVNAESDLLPHIAVDIPDDKTTYTFDDLIQGNCIPTMSCLFRNPRLSSIPDYLLRTDMADWPLHLITATNGPLHYKPVVQAAYRIHDQGIWHSFRNSRTQAMLSQIRVWELLHSAGIISRETLTRLSERNLRILFKENRKQGNKAAFLQTLQDWERLHGKWNRTYLRQSLRYRCMHNPE